jgi:hypothetical protein
MRSIGQSASEPKQIRGPPVLTPSRPTKREPIRSESAAEGKTASADGPVDGREHHQRECRALDHTTTSGLVVESLVVVS